MTRPVYLSRKEREFLSWVHLRTPLDINNAAMEAYDSLVIRGLHGPDDLTRAAGRQALELHRLMEGE